MPVCEEVLQVLQNAEGFQRTMLPLPREMWESGSRWTHVEMWPGLALLYQSYSPFWNVVGGHLRAAGKPRGEK